MNLKALLKPAPDKADLAMTIIRVIVGITFWLMFSTSDLI